VVAYALAQSLALAIAGLGMWTPPPALVAPGVALSIAYLGIENCLARDARPRWRGTFAFGLVHGFAFAGVLGTVATSAATRPLALASFHLGIEAGQLAAAVAMLAMLSWLGRRAWVVRGGNVVLAAIGVGWLVASVAG
jgi:hypothetical protein